MTPRSVRLAPAGRGERLVARLLDQRLDRASGGVGVRRLVLLWAASWSTARAFSAYLARGGSRRVPLPDSFIGAHAEAAGVPLLTRDPGRIRIAFPGVRLIAPDGDA